MDSLVVLTIGGLPDEFPTSPGVVVSQVRTLARANAEGIGVDPRAGFWGTCPLNCYCRVCTRCCGPPCRRRLNTEHFPPVQTEHPSGRRPASSPQPGCGEGGRSAQAIARRLGMSRNTVARLLGFDEAPRYVRAPQGSQLGPFAEAIAAMLGADPMVPGEMARSTGGTPGHRCRWARASAGRPSPRDHAALVGGPGRGLHPGPHGGRPAPGPGGLPRASRRGARGARLRQRCHGRGLAGGWPGPPARRGAGPPGRPAHAGHPGRSRAGCGCSRRTIRCHRLRRSRRRHPGHAIRGPLLLRGPAHRDARAQLRARRRRPRPRTWPRLCACPGGPRRLRDGDVELPPSTWPATTALSGCRHERQDRLRGGLPLARPQGAAHPGRGLPARRARPRGGLGPRDVSRRRARRGGRGPRQPRRRGPREGGALPGR